MMRAIALASFTLLTACGGSTFTVAVVDHQYALTQCGHGQAATAQLRQQFEERHAALEQRHQALEAAHTALEQARASHAANVAELENRYAQDHVHLDADTRAFQRDVGAADQTVGGEIGERLATVIQELAQERQVDLVVDRSIVAVASHRVVDLTEDAVHRYNERFPVAAGAAPAATEAPAPAGGGEQPAAGPAPTTPPSAAH